MDMGVEDFTVGRKVHVRMDGCVQFQFVPKYGVMASGRSDRPVSSDIGDGAGIYVSNRYRLIPTVPAADDGRSSDTCDRECSCSAAVAGPVAALRPAASLGTTAGRSPSAGATATATAAAAAVASAAREEATLEGPAEQCRDRSEQVPPARCSNGPATVRSVTAATPTEAISATDAPDGGLKNKRWRKLVDSAVTKGLR